MLQPNKRGKIVR